MSRFTPLALAVAQAKRLGGRPAREADHAMLTLAPFITETARRIHGRYYSLRRQLASDFVSHSPAMVWNRIEHFEDWYYQELPPAVRDEGPAKDFFAAWCYRELHFRYLDAGRGQKAEPKVAPLDNSAAADVADHRSEPDAPSVYDFDLAPDEVARLRDEWDPLDAVILFALGGQSSQVPAELWQHWLAALSLKPPFPPPEFEAAPKVKRRAVLADALHVSRDVIFQRWHRLKGKYLK
jgi:hypothetical protein